MPNPFTLEEAIESDESGSPVYSPDLEPIESTEQREPFSLIEALGPQVGWPQPEPGASLADVLKQPSPQIDPWMGEVAPSALPGTYQPEQALSPPQIPPSRIANQDLSQLVRPEGIQGQLEAAKDIPEPFIKIPSAPDIAQTPQTWPEKILTKPIRSVLGDKAADVQAQVTRTLYNAAKSVPEFLETEEGILSLLASTNPLGRAGVTAYFTYDMSKSLMEQAKEAGGSWDELSTLEKAKAITEAATTLGFAGLLGSHLVGQAKALPKMVQAKLPKPRPATPEQRVARETLAEAEAKATSYEYQMLEETIPDYPNKVAHVTPDGTIVVSKPNLHRYLENYIGEDITPEEAIKRAIGHEAVHSATWLLEGGEKKATDFWNDFSGIERLALRRIIPRGKELPDLTMGQESIRYMLEKASGKPSELLAAVNQAGLKVQSLDKLLDVTLWIRKNIGKTEASTRQMELLDVIDGNIKAARAAAAKGPTDAREEQEAAEVPGDVLKKPIKGEGKVPVEERVPGVQPQAEGRVAEKPREEVLLDRGGTPDEGFTFGEQKPIRNEFILEAAYVSDDGTIYYGSHHPGALKKAGVTGFEERESRNIPRFGYRTNKRPFVGRDLGGAVAEISGQDLRVFDEPIHSDQSKSAIEPGKTVAEQRDLQTPPLKAPPTAQTGEAPPAAPAKGAAKPPEPVKPAGVEPAISEPTPTRRQAQVKGPARKAYEDYVNSVRGVKRTREHMGTIRRLLKAAEAEDKEGQNYGHPITDMPALEMERATPNERDPSKIADALGLRYDGEGPMPGSMLFTMPKADSTFAVKAGGTLKDVHARYEEMRKIWEGDKNHPPPPKWSPAKPEEVAKEMGWTYNPTKQIGSIRLEGLSEADLTKLSASGRGPDWEFTDRRKGSPTEGVTFYVPEKSSREDILARRDDHLKQRGLESPGLEMEQEAVWEETRKEYASATEKLDAVKSRAKEIQGELGEIETKRSGLQPDSPESKALEQRGSELEKEQSNLSTSYRALSAQQTKATHQLRSINPEQTKQIDGIVSKMIPKGLTYSRKSIEECAAYVLSLPKEMRDEALHRFELGMKKVEEANTQQQLSVANVSQAKQFEQITANLAEVRMGAIAYLRMGLLPKVEPKVEGAPAPGGAEIPKTVLPTAEKGWAPKKVTYRTPTFDKWSSMVLGEFQLGGQVSKEQLRPIWNEAVADFLYGASKEKLNELRTAHQLNWGRYRGELPEPNTDPIVWELEKNPGKYPEDFYRIAMSLGVDMRGPELGGPAGWEKQVEDYLLERKAENDKELYARLHPESAGVVRKEGKAAFVSGARDPLTKEERLKVIGDYAREQSLMQARRARVIGELHRKMVESSRVAGRSPLRKTITIEDIDFSHQSKTGSYMTLNAREGRDLDFLQALLASESAGTAKATKRLILLVDDAIGDGELVSVFRSYPERELMVYDPSGQPGDKSLKHIPLKDLLKDYRVRASILVADPVHHFHQRWPSLQSKTGELRFMQEIGFDAEREAGGGRAWKDLNVTREIQKQTKARATHEARFGMSREQKEAFVRLKKLAEESPEKLSEDERLQLKELYDLEFSREQLAEEVKRRRAEEKGEEAPEEEMREEGPEAEESEGDVKELAARQGSAGHFVDWSLAVDPDSMEAAHRRRYGDAGFDITDIETLPSDWKRLEANNGLLRQIYTHTFLNRPMSSIEADALGRIFNEHEISQPSDIRRVLNDMQQMADSIDPTTGKPRGLRGQYYSVVSALDKVGRKYYAEMISDPKEVKADFLDYCIENGLKPDAAAKAAHHTELKISALEQALFDVYDIAQSSKRKAKGKVQPKVPYSLAEFRQKAMERYGDTARRDIEQLALSEERVPTRREAIARIGRRLGGIDPKVLDYYAKQLPSAQRKLALERAAAMTQRPSALREIPLRAGVTVPIQGGVTAGKGLRTAPLPPEMLQPGAQASVASAAQARFGNLPPIPGSALAPMPGMARRWNPNTGRWEQVGKPPKVVGEPLQYTRRRMAGPGKKYSRLVQESPTGMDPEVIQEMKIRQAVESPGLEMDISETEWGPSRRAWAEMQAQGRRGELPEKAEPESLPELISMGEKMFNTGSVDPEATMKRAETGRGNTADIAVIRYWGRELQRVSDETGRKSGYRSNEYLEDAAAANEWAKRILDVSSQSGTQLAMFRGNEDVDYGSVTFVRREAAKRKRGRGTVDKELSDEESAYTEERAADVEMGIGATDKAKRLVSETLNKPPPLDKSQADLVEGKMNDLERMLAMERAEYNKRHPQGPGMAMQGPEGKPAPLSDSDLRFLAREGGSIMFRLSREGELSDATWRETMLKEHPEASGHLDRIQEEAIKFRNEFIAYSLGMDKATAPARHALTRKKPSIADSLIIVERAVAMDPRGKRISHTEAYHMWNLLKQRYMQPDKEGVRPDFDAMITRASEDTGIDPERIFRAMASNKTLRKVTKDMYDKMAYERRAISQAKNWLKNLEFPKWYRIARKFPRMTFAAKVAGHGFVGLVTHASNLLFNPWAWKVYFPAWAKMYSMVMSEEYHTRAMRQLVNRDHYRDWKKAGLQVDPFRHTDDYYISEVSKWVNKFAGGRGFDALKTLRYDLAELAWSRTPEKLRTDAMRELWANEVNHSTGIIKTSLGVFGEPMSWTFFAHKLMLSQWAFLFKDPLKAMDYMRRWNTATPEQRHWAKSILMQRAASVGIYYALLMANQGFLKAIGSDQEVNTTDVTKSDFWQFKVAGFKVGVAGPMIGIVRMLADMLHLGQGELTKFESLETRQSSLGERATEYLRGKASPFASMLIDAYAGQNPQGRPLPWSDDKIPISKRVHGINEYTWPEYVTGLAAPIPVEEVIKEVWKGMGMDDLTINRILKALAAGSIMAGTGARVTEDEQ